MEIKFEYLGGRTNAIIQTFIRGTIGIGFIIAGIVMAITQRETLYLVIFGLIGIIALLNSWWWYRRSKRF
ncbi:hypothetical protein KAR91_35385 [Candidatus Pacearchaeota archaeon]|nr:hypothetical protein [Candidatus Pacearchaeota archaeon]